MDRLINIFNKNPNILKFLLNVTCVRIFKVHCIEQIMFSKSSENQLVLGLLEAGEGLFCTQTLLLFS